MKKNNLHNFTSVLAFVACFTIAPHASNISHAQDYGVESIELEVDQIEMPDAQANEATEVVIKEATPETVIEAASEIAKEVVPEVAADAPSQASLESEVVGVTNAPAAPEVDTDEGDGNDEYFDAFAGDDDLTGDTAPRRVDPRYEPGSKFIVVRKDASASSQQAMLTAANRALSLGRYSSAVEMFETLRKRNPRDKNVLMGLGIAQQNMGFTESAIATYRSVLKLDPRNVNAKVNMLGLLQKHNPQKAHKELMHLWSHNPRDPGVAAQIGLVSAELGNTDDAVRFLGIASSIEPSNPMHIYNMAVIYDRAGASKDALKLYEQALQVDASNSSNNSLQRDTIYDRLAKLRRL